MLWVLLSLLPAAAAHVHFFGYGLIVNFALAALSGTLLEALILTLRRRSLHDGLGDLATLVTAALLAFAMPSLAPWWLTVSAMGFAVLLAKHVYGGIGRHPFNPAMVGYAVLLVSFPAQMTAWLPPGAADLSVAATLQAILSGTRPEALSADLISAASPLAAVRAGLAASWTMEEIFAQSLFGSLSGEGWEWVNLLILAGGATLLALRVIGWQIPAAMLASVCACALVAHVADPGKYPGPVFNLLSGATMLGAFYIATDPTTAAHSPYGKLLYGTGIGLLTYAIRTWGQYHDGVAFAVLLMNLAAPLIDRFVESADETPPSAERAHD